jgi:hypothetical protein
VKLLICLSEKWQKPSHKQEQNNVVIHQKIFQIQEIVKGWILMTMTSKYHMHLTFRIILPILGNDQAVVEFSYLFLLNELQNDHGGTHVLIQKY